MPKLLKGDEIKLMRVLSRLVDNALAACKVHSPPKLTNLYHEVRLSTCE